MFCQNLLRFLSLPVMSATSMPDLHHCNMPSSTSLEPRRHIYYSLDFTLLTIILPITWWIEVKEGENGSQSNPSEIFRGLTTNIHHHLQHSKSTEKTIGKTHRCWPQSLSKDSNMEDSTSANKLCKSSKNDFGDTRVRTFIELEGMMAQRVSKIQESMRATIRKLPLEETETDYDLIYKTRQKVWAAE